MKSTEEDMSIGEVAGRFGLATHVLRHWESVGVLRPARRANGRRRYGPEHLAQVALVLQGKEAGFSLEQLAEMFQAEDGAARRRILAGHAAELDRRIARLQEARRIVEHPMHCPEEDFLRCPGLAASLRGFFPVRDANAGGGGAEEKHGECAG